MLDFGLIHEERVHDVGVEVGAAAAADDVVAGVQGHGVSIAALGGYGVEHVGDGHDAGAQRYVRAAQALGIALAVPLFMVVERDLMRHALVLDVEQVAEGIGDDPAADGGVLLHLLELLGREAAGLLQYRVGDADLADVVHRRGLDEVVEVVLRDDVVIAPGAAQVFRDEAGVGRRAADVAAGIAVLVLDERGKAHHHLAVVVLEAVDGGVFHGQVDAEQYHRRGDAGDQRLGEQDLQREYDDDEHDGGGEAGALVAGDIAVLPEYDAERERAVEHHADKADVDRNAHGIIGIAPRKELYGGQKGDGDGGKRCAGEDQRGADPAGPGDADGDGHPVPEQQRHKGLVGQVHAQMREQVDPARDHVQQVDHAGGRAVKQHGDVRDDEAGIEYGIAVVLVGDAVEMRTLADVGDPDVGKDQQAHNLRLAPLQHHHVRRVLLVVRVDCLSPWI